MTSSAPGPLVLIVDDDERNLKLACDVLNAAGFRTLTAADGAGALALAEEESPDLVLLDLRLPDLDGRDVARALARGARTRDIPVVALSALPDMDGRDVVRALREDGRTAHIPVVALTAVRYPDGGTRLLADGFLDYLEKPIDVRTFPEQVRRYCGNPRA